MNLFSEYRNRVIGAVEELASNGELPQDLNTSRISVEPPREASHGDLATNAAMVLAKQAGMKPRDSRKCWSLTRSIRNLCRRNCRPRFHKHAVDSAAGMRYWRILRRGRRLAHLTWERGARSMSSMLLIQPVRYISVMRGTYSATR